MCFGFKESSGCAPNILSFKNQLAANRVISVSCESNLNEKKGLVNVKFNDVYSFPVVEASRRIVWRCKITDAKTGSFFMLDRAYRGAYNPRCGQTREYIVGLTGLSLLRNKAPTNKIVPWTVAKV
ncbi:unnamed protein product [Eruca vesicaria subsp. sativa]|uniref:S-protein homolog n=1 Tax=Eruca vesicaria subsp. sativa TaxID=29727 RepID=A0ABC8LWX9_ERUVS|nr:unnamed protein product [Eruca vesicaria subsp. sativa]